MIKEIRFTVTGMVRPPLAGEWFLGHKGMPIQAIHDFHTTRFPILRVDVTEGAEDKVREKVA